MPKTKPTSIVKLVEDRKQQISKYAIRQYNQQEFRQSIEIAVSESAGLQKCLETTEGQNSMWHAIKIAAGTGLSLNPQLGEAALVPIKGKVTYQTMKNGLVRLALESGNVDFITSDMVRENDLWDMWKTFEGDGFKHVPAKTDRGPVIGYYAGLKMKDGSTHLKYMEVKECQEHGQKYSFFYSDKNGAWQKSFNGMAIKTVIKALFRNLHISDDTKAAVGADDQSEQEILTVQATPVKGTSADDAMEALGAQEEYIEPEPEPENEPEQAQERNTSDGDLF